MRSFAALTVSAALATTVVASSHKGAHVDRRAQPGWIKRRALGAKRAAAVGTDSSLLTVANATSAPTWYNGTALWFEATGGQSACYTVTTNDDLIVGLSTDLWPDTGVVSSLCGQSMFIRNTETGANVTVSIQDASGKNYTTLSKAAFSALGDLVTGMLPIEYYVFNGTTNFTSAPVVAAAAVSSSTVARTTRSAVPTHSAAPVTTSSSKETPTTTATPTSTVDWDAINAASSASAASVWSEEQAASSASAASAWAAEQYASSTAAAAASAEAAAAASASQASADAAAASASAAQQQAVVAAAAATTSASSSSGGDWYTGGSVTYFYQNGVAGACGTVHADTDYVAALFTSTYAGGSNCGRKIQLVNDAGASVTVTVADECPTCNGANFVDLSVSAFLQLGTEAQGMVPMKWKFLD